MTTRSILVLSAVAAAFAIAGPAHGQTNPPGVDPEHFQCYRPEFTVAFDPIGVSLRDQFGKADVRVVRVLFLCAPVSKNGEEVKDVKTHLVCYSIVNGITANKAVRTKNQFGGLEFKVGRSGILCVPSVKRVIP